MRAGPAKYPDLIAEIEAMQPHDLFIWRIPPGVGKRTLHSYLAYWAGRFGGPDKQYRNIFFRDKLFVVRVV